MKSRKLLSLFLAILVLGITFVVAHGQEDITYFSGCISTDSKCKCSGSSCEDDNNKCQNANGECYTDLFGVECFCAKSIN